MLKIPAFWVVVLLTIISFTSWYLVYTNISPIESSQIAFPSFYISLFFSTTFIFSLFASQLWKIFISTLPHYECLKNGLREGMLIGLGLTISLVFMQYASLSWREILLISIFLLGIEIIFIKSSQK